MSHHRFQSPCNLVFLLKHRPRLRSLFLTPSYCPIFHSWQIPPITIVSRWTMSSPTPFTKQSNNSPRFSNQGDFTFLNSVLYFATQIKTSQSNILLLLFTTAILNSLIVAHLQLEQLLRFTFQLQKSSAYSRQHQHI